MGLKYRRTPSDLRELWPSWVEVDPETDCWNWCKSKTKDGYGQMGGRPLGYTMLTAHKAAYLLFVGPVAKGFHVHHTCNNRQCCNPAHLVALTATEHHAEHHDQDNCIAGHPWAEFKTLSKRGTRVCRECERLRARRRFAANTESERARYRARRARAKAMSL